MPALAGVSHLGFSVPHVEAASAFWCDGLGFERQSDEPAFTFLLHREARIAVILTSHAGTVRGGFSERNPGLDHVSFAVGDVEELRRWAERFPGPDGQPTAITETDAGWHLNIRGPADFPVELYAMSDAFAASLGLSDGAPVAATHG